jgi:hypothetical protein
MNTKNFEFWYLARIKYPDEYKRFMDWLDEYALKNYFIFHIVHDIRDGKGIEFNDLPIEIQYGIVQRYYAERHKVSHPEIEDYIREQIIDLIK